MMVPAICEVLGIVWQKYSWMRSLVLCTPTHCYGHSLNLAVGDSIKRCKVMQSSLDVVFEISKLIKKSPKRDAIFQRLKDEIAVDTPGFRVLCPTRWTVHAASLQSVLDNYEVLLQVWEESKETNLESEI